MCLLGMFLVQSTGYGEQRVLNCYKTTNEVRLRYVPPVSILISFSLAYASNGPRSRPECQS